MAGQAVSGVPEHGSLTACPDFEWREGVLDRHGVYADVRESYNAGCNQIAASGRPGVRPYWQHAER